MNARALSIFPGILDTLRAARTRIAEPDAWTNSLARTATGIPTMPESPRARRWCAEGALLAEAAACERAASYLGEARGALVEAAHDLYGRGLLEVEHDLGHAGALAVFDHAIARVAAAAGER